MISSGGLKTFPIGMCHIRTRYSPFKVLSRLNNPTTSVHICSHYNVFSLHILVLIIFKNSLRTSGRKFGGMEAMNNTIFLEATHAHGRHLVKVMMVVSCPLIWLGLRQDGSCVVLVNLMSSSSPKTIMKAVLTISTLLRIILTKSPR